MDNHRDDNGIKVTSVNKPIWTHDELTNLRTRHLRYDSAPVRQISKAISRLQEALKPYQSSLGTIHCDE